MSGPPIPERELRSRVRQRMDKGSLPVIRVANLDAGYGREHVCDVCDQQIAPAQIEYEVPADSRGTPLRFHIKCFAVWQLECAQRLEAQGGAPSSERSQSGPDTPSDSGDGTLRGRPATHRLAPM